jgi:hypothetical protein
VVVANPDANLVVPNNAGAAGFTFLTADTNPFLAGRATDGGTFTGPSDRLRKTIVMKRVTSQGAVIPARTNNGTINTLNAPVGLPGLYWFAYVRLEPPNEKTDLSYIQVGFIQHVTINRLRGRYTNGQWLRSPMEGHTYLDMGSGERPFYRSLPAGTSVFSNATQKNRSKVIGAHDTPEPGVPVTFQQHSPKEFAANKPPAIRLDRIEMDLSFTTEVAASLQGPPPARPYYWQEASMHWSFVGSGNVDPPTLAWTGDAAAGVTAPTAWAQNRGGPSSIDVTGPTGNSELDKRDFG